MNSMNTQEKREAIRIKVVEAIPSILYIEKGCRVIPKSEEGIEFFYKWKFGEESGESEHIPIEIHNYVGSSTTYEENEYIDPVVTYGFFDPLMYEYRTITDYSSQYGDVEYPEDFYIIGRPITALDILRAVDFHGKVLCFNVYSENIECDYDNGKGEFYINLSQTLDQWDENTINKIFELLVD